MIIPIYLWIVETEGDFTYGELDEVIVWAHTKEDAHIAVINQYFPRGLRKNQQLKVTLAPKTGEVTAHYHPG